MADLFLCNLGHRFFARLAVGAILSIASVAAGAEYNAAEFFPIEPGNYWVYDNSDGGWTTRVEPDTVDVNGIATRQLTESDGWAQWMTNDELGLRVHGDFDPDGRSAPVTSSYVPPSGSWTLRFTAVNTMPSPVN